MTPVELDGPAAYGHDDGQADRATGLEAAAVSVTVAVGSVAAGVSTADLVLDLGPHHPSSHGVLRLRLTLDGEVVTSCEPLVGHLHRGVEKLFEVRDYRQILVLANRHDWHSAFSSELGVALAVERMVGLEVPPRATWARTLLAELTRVLHHLTFLGSRPRELASPAPHAAALVETNAARERVLAVMEEVSGGRVHYVLTRVGGLREDLPAGWLGRVDEAVASVRERLPALTDLVLGDERFAAGTRGVGVLSAAAVDAYGVSGPVARASGVDLDLRRDDPYLAYRQLAHDGVLTVPLREEGDCWARFGLLLDQLAVSLDLVDACSERLRSLAPGPVNVPLPKILRAPEGSTYAWTESPAGINGYYLVSRGEKTPWRLKLRTASFGNVAVLAELVPGCRVADLVAVLTSLFYVVGDLDK